MRFASWNVNSIKIRIDTVLEWLIDKNIDVLALQEIKCEDQNFPYEKFEEKGYFSEVVGQKSYNGVGIISKMPIKIKNKSLPFSEEENNQARYLEAEIDGFNFASIYLPNGNPINTPKFEYKIMWMKCLIQHTKNLLKNESPIILAGDFNVIPEDRDCWEPSLWIDDALAIKEIRALFRTLKYIGYHDSFRILNPQAVEWSFWDYQGGAWNKDNGIRIDHLLMNSFAIDKLKKCNIDKSPRGKNKPSDHVPIWCEF